MAKEIPIVTIEYNHLWDCPDCGWNNDADHDGDGIVLPLVCSDCNAIFSDYEKDFDEKL